MSGIGGAKRTAEDDIEDEPELHASKRKREQAAEGDEASEVCVPAMTALLFATPFARAGGGRQ